MKKNRYFCYDRGLTGAGGGRNLNFSAKYFVPH